MTKRYMGVMAAVAAIITLCFNTYAAADEEKEAAEARAGRAERIKNSPKYYYGVGRGLTEDEADRNAVEDLCSKISLGFSGKTVIHDTQDSESFTSEGIISTYVRLNNTEKFEVNGQEGKWEILRYVERSQVEAAEAARADKVRSLVDEGIAQEKRVAIGNALKYFNWAYALSRACRGDIELDIDGKKQNAKTWLNAHINAMMSTLQFDLAGAEYDENEELDPYTVNLKVTYKDQPVEDLDFSYNNAGITVRNQVVKNGRATLAFAELPKKNIDFSVDYRYEDACRDYDEEIAAVYAKGKKQRFAKADIKIPCNGMKAEDFKVSEIKMTAQDKKETEAQMALAPTEVSAPKTRIAVQEVADGRSPRLIDAMGRVKNAIDSRKYADVKDLFTADGYKLFMQMMSSGKVKSAMKNDNWKVEMAGDYVVGRSIPVTIKYNGGHTVAEDIVFRFNSDDRIASLAYALTKRAEDDIFKQNAWDYNARFAILQFMEDYQTAYALKRIDYIESIFSDDAVIISGSRAGSRLRGQSKGDVQYFVEDNFTFRRETKDQYINRLRAQFPQKKYIKLSFEDNEIRQQSGISNSIYWIELRQFYQSSNYNDMGYLTLMIDMQKENPQIHVRTWAPGKIPLQELMSRYTQN